VLRKLDRIADEIGQDLTQAFGITDQRRRYLRGNLADQLQSSAIGVAGECFHGPFDGGVEIEFMQVEFDLPRFNLGKIQNVIEHPQERLSGTAYGLCEVALPLVEASAEQQFRHAQDAVERGPDFVAHVGQELRFGLVGLRRLSGQAGLFLNPFFQFMLIGIYLLAVVPKALNHQIEVPGEVFDLIMRADGDGVVDLALGDLTGDAGQLLDGRSYAPGHGNSEADSHQDDQAGEKHRGDQERADLFLQSRHVNPDLDIADQKIIGLGRSPFEFENPAEIVRSCPIYRGCDVHVRFAGITVGELPEAEFLFLSRGLLKVRERGLAAEFLFQEDQVLGIPNDHIRNIRDG